MSLGIFIVGAAALLLAVQGGFVAAALVPPALVSAAVATSLFCVIRYLSDPSVARYRAAYAVHKQARRKLREAKRSIEAGAREKTLRQEHHTTAQKKVLKARSSLEEREKREIAAVQSTRQSRIQEINTHRRTLLQQQAAALQKIQTDLGGKIAILDRQIRDLNQAESADLANTLRAQQQQYLNAYLSRFHLATATVSGIGATFKSRLIAAGFRTAADVDLYRVQRVPGIGHTRAAWLSAWRQALAAGAQNGVPQALSATDTTAIQSRYRSQRVALEVERDRHQRRQQDEQEAVRARDRLKLDDFDRAESQEKKAAADQIAQIQLRYAAQYTPLDDALSTLVADLQNDLANIDAGVHQTRKDIFQLTWQEAQARNYVRTFAAITFLLYVRRVIPRRP